MSEWFSYLLPPAILVLLILAPRRQGRPRWSGSNRLAMLVAAWAVAAVVIGVIWNRYGFAILWNVSGSP